ncbi:MAG: hypothetical protein RR671_02560 [Raoultibacter sp.]
MKGIGIKTNLKLLVPQRAVKMFFTAAIIFFTLCFSLTLTPPVALAASGHAFVGGAWMVDGQSYFTVHILGRSTTGYCLNRGAAEPLPGYYPYTARVTLSGSGGSTNLWLEGAGGDAYYDQASNVSRSPTITFQAGTPNASWSFTVPAHCHVSCSGGDYEPGSTVTLYPGQSFHLSTTDPFAAGDSSGRTEVGGIATADASTTTLYSDIVITPPGAWDGISYHNGLPAGYQRVGVGSLAFHHSAIKTDWLGFSTRWLANVRYFTDGDNTPCAVERAILGAPYTPPTWVNQSAAKANCTPGLDAWYRDMQYRTLYHTDRLTEDTDLYGRNIATLSYLPAATSAVQSGLSLHDCRDTAAATLELADILPQSRTVDWGSTVKLSNPQYTLLYLHDGERWRTLRRFIDGWYRSPSAVGNPVSALKIEGNTAVYDSWLQSTYDGVLDW